MLVIDMQIYPVGDKTRARSLGKMEIHLDAVDPSHLIGEYSYKIRKWTKGEGVWREGKVRGHHRKKRGPWDLLFRCLLDAVASRNTDCLAPFVQEGYKLGKAAEPAESE